MLGNIWPFSHEQWDVSENIFIHFAAEKIAISIPVLGVGKTIG